MSINPHSEKEPWYGVRSLFYDDQNGIYEERTILVKASSHAEAIELAEEEAKKYASEVGGIQYLSYSDTFHIFEKKIDSGTEIFSLTRKTQMSRDEYIDRFLDSGMENRADDAA